MVAVNGVEKVFRVLHAVAFPERVQNRLRIVQLLLQGFHVRESSVDDALGVLGVYVLVFPGDHRSIRLAFLLQRV